jgi:hypothetical protein
MVKDSREWRSGVIQCSPVCEIIPYGESSTHKTTRVIAQLRESSPYFVLDECLKRVIENAYSSKKDDGGDDDNKNKNVLDTGKKLLRPIAIAQMMPQIFWSLIYHCRPCLESDSNIQE